MAEIKTFALESVSSSNMPAIGVRAPLFYNPKDPGFNDDPYPHYKRLREEDPVHRSATGVWCLSRYEDVRAVLKDRRFAARDVPGQLRTKGELLKSLKVSDRQPNDLDAIVAMSQKWLPMLEAPDHGRIRRLVTQAFQKHTVERMRLFIREFAQKLLHKAKSHGSMDMMTDFACILPQRTIAAILGVPEEDFPRVSLWVADMTRIFDPFVSLEQLAQLNQAAFNCTQYLAALIQKRRDDPQDDFITALIAARDEQDMLSENELISTILVLFGAGEETAVNMIGNGTLALCRHPDKKEYLRSHPEITEKAVEELLRYDAPLQMTARTPLEDVELRNKVIPKGANVYVIFGSANRDPDQFPNADDLVLDREQNHHMAFGDGRHYCIGAPLARIEGQEAFRAIFEVLPNFELVNQRPRWREHTVLRGIRSLPIRFL